jgi:Cep192 domain 4
MLKYRGALVLMALLLMPSMAWSANNNPLLVGGPNDLPSRPEGPLDFATSPPGAHLTYYGGRVVSNMKVVQVLWGTGGVGTGDGKFLAQVVNTTTPSIASFYQQVLNSGYVDWLTEYNTDITDFGGNPGTNQTIGRGSFSEQVAITPVNTATTLSDADIQTELVNQIKAGHVPLPTADGAGNNNTYYAIFFPHGITITMGGESSCAFPGFCAYHGTIVASAPVGEIYYGVHPDMQPGSGCESGCGANPTPFNNLTSVASHEMGETITDCEVGIAPTLNEPPLAWYDDVNGEIGDICNAQQGSILGGDGHTYTVQKLFSNVANDCIVVPGMGGGGPNLNVTPTSKNFGFVKVRKIKKQTFTLTNEGSSGQTITFSNPLAIVSNFPIFSFPRKGATTCHRTLPSKGQCKLTLQFRASQRGAPETGTLTIFDDAGNANQSISLSGTGK